jgi:hypothetical protein
MRQKNSEIVLNTDTYKYRDSAARNKQSPALQCPLCMAGSPTFDNINAWLFLLQGALNWYSWRVTSHIPDLCSMKTWHNNERSNTPYNIQTGESSSLYKFAKLSFNWKTIWNSLLVLKQKMVFSFQYINWFLEGTLHTCSEVHSQFHTSQYSKQRVCDYDWTDCVWP